MKPRMILAVILLTLFLIITLQNTEVATFKILFWDVDISRIVFMYLAVLIGFIAGFITAKFSELKKEAAGESQDAGM